MKPHSSRLQHGQKEQAVEAQQMEQHTTAREFTKAEEVIRADAAQTEVPESVKTRLAESVQKEPRPEPPSSWWRRLFL